MRLFGMTRPTNRMLVQSSSNSCAIKSLGGEIEMREIGNDRQHARGIEPERFEFLAVELGIAKRQIDAGRVDAELAAPLEALLDELLVHVDEELRWRDVVIDENLPIGQRVGDAGCARADREVMDQDVRRIARLDQVAVVARLIFEPGIGRLHEDVGLEPGSAKNALDAEHFVADGVAIAEGCEHLMDLLVCQFSTGPKGSSARTSLAGRRSLRRFANQPGSGSMPLPESAAAHPLPSDCASMSRYFCSITGHA